MDKYLSFFLYPFSSLKSVSSVQSVYRGTCKQRLEFTQVPGRVKIYEDFVKNLDTLYRIGDFAKLCGTTIDTLLHYEDVGILKPALKKDNGWRYYLYIQFFTFETISALKQSGCSLDEIRQYLFTTDLQTNRTLLDERQKELNKELVELLKAKKALKESIESIDCAMSQPMNSIELVTLPEERIVVENSDSEEHTFQENDLGRIENIQTRLDEFDQLCERLEFVKRVLPCLLFDKDKIRTGDCRQALLFHPISSEEYSAVGKLKPGGMYVSMVTQGVWPDSFPTATERITTYMNENHWTLNGDVYVYPLKTACTENNRLNIVYRILVPVRAERGIVKQ